MKIFINVKTSTLWSDANILSIAAVSQNGKIFYGEIDRNQLEDNCSSFVKEHELPLMVGGDKEVYYPLTITGNIDSVIRTFIHWLMQFKSVEFVGDCFHRIFTILYEKIYDYSLKHSGGMAKGIAKFNALNISEVGIDINHYIMEKYNLNSRDAFNKDRSEILYQYRKDEFMSGPKHHALNDAFIILIIYNLLVLKATDDSAIYCLYSSIF